MSGNAKRGSLTASQLSALRAEDQAVEAEINRLEHFFAVVPQMREEARRTVPATRETSYYPAAPTRQELRRTKLAGYFSVIRLVIFAGCFVGSALWVLDRYYRLMGG